MKTEAMKNQIEALFKKLTNHKKVLVTSIHQNKQNHWDYYYYLDGFYGSLYFGITIYKNKLKEPRFKISTLSDLDKGKIQELLKTLTEIKFELS